MQIKYDIVAKFTTVPITPNINMYGKFLKNLRFFMLKPAENIIGGRIRLNRACSLNSNLYVDFNEIMQLHNIDIITRSPLS